MIISCKETDLFSLEQRYKWYELAMGIGEMKPFRMIADHGCQLIMRANFKRRNWISNTYWTIVKYPNEWPLFPPLIKYVSSKITKHKSYVYAPRDRWTDR